MSDDPTVHWQQATRFGILVNEAADAWYSGRANDVLVLGNGALLVASSTGGVWSISPSGDPLPLSDSWNNPDVRCLAAGPDGTDVHVFAGCGGSVIRETNLGAAVPLFDWTELDAPLPAGAGEVRRIVVIRNQRRIVAACEGGLYFATIPATSERPGCLFPFGGKPRPRAPYVWRQAVLKGATARGFWDVAIAATHDERDRSNLEDPRVITVVAGAFKQGGILVGQWDPAGDLVLQHPKLSFEGGADATFLLESAGTTSVSSCEFRPTVVYAALARSDGRLDAIARSRDGGLSFEFCAAHVEGDENPLALVQTLAGEQGDDWNNCISVSPTNPGLVALGWQQGPFLTRDGGKNWRPVADADHLHPDLHALQFWPRVAADEHDLYVCSDGGVARIDLDDLLGATGRPFQSNYNRQLPTLQCYGPLFRGPFGSLGASPRQSGLLAAGLQDNGNVFCQLGAKATPWQDLDGGDDGWNAFASDGSLLHYTMSGPVAASSFTAAGALISTVVIPVLVPPSPGGLGGPVGEHVVAPQHRNAARQLLVAAGAVGNLVYALYLDELASPRFHWDLVATLPAGVAVSALYSQHGGTIFAGSKNDGRMFAVDAKQGTFLELPVVLPKPSPRSRMRGGSFVRLSAFSETEVFAVLDGAIEDPVPGTSSGIGIPPPPPATASYVLKLDSLRWVPTAGAGLPNERFFSLAAVALPHSEFPRALFVATDDRVYVSRDDGASWQRAALGLPRRPHCSELRFVGGERGEGTLYLSTYGRSVWTSPLAAG